MNSRLTQPQNPKKVLTDRKLAFYQRFLCQIKIKTIKRSSILRRYASSKISARGIGGPYSKATVVVAPVESVTVRFAPVSSADVMEPDPVTGEPSEFETWVGSEPSAGM